MNDSFVLKDFKPTSFTDNYGNTWANATFEGLGEPVKWVVKDPNTVKVGETYYGEIKEQTSKAGKPYLRFYRKENPEGASAKDSDGMYRCNALNNAVAYHEGQTEGYVNVVLETADTFYKWLKGEDTGMDKVQPDEAIGDM